MYEYDLPKDLIANAPAEPRDSSRLLVYKVETDLIIEDTFINLAKYLPARSVLVLNDTRVVPARLELKKQTGGSVRILFLVNEWDHGEIIKGLPDRKLKIRDKLFVKDPGIAHPGSNNSRCLINGACVEVVAQNNEEFTFKLLVESTDFGKLLNVAGKTPLPPYIHTDLDELDLREKYQTTFSQNPASVAAPTASLHFTDRVFDSLSQKGIEKVFVTLHVGRGTFSPANAQSVKDGRLHEEPIHVGGAVINKLVAAKKSGKRIIASGTTATRALESAALNPDADSTSLFIKPPYDFRIIDGLITNFHLPNTSLLMLLDAFLQFRGAKKSWRDLYDYAVNNKFRFYSFGDAMLII